MHDNPSMLLNLHVIRLIVCLHVQNLLFVTEFVQIKAVMLRVESLRRMIEKELSLSFHLDLPHELPVRLDV